MRIPRIYTPQTISTGQCITLEEQASAHLSRALRFQPGDTVRLFNGFGGEYTAIISAISKKNVELLPGEYQADNAQSPLNTHIAVGVSKGEKMDLIVQKCTELGVTAIYPIITERSDVKLNEERWQKKVERWQEIAISACEQSARNLLPTLHAVQTFSQWLDNTCDIQRCLFHPEGDVVFSSINITGTLAMAFGSEGGFSDNEITLARKSGCHIARLGPRVLRAETAPIAALAIAQAQWGDLLI
jgi:16S rRNA (uracil1498-N3)-methyltransferase